MKILHTSDWHLGQNFMGKSREDEHRAFLDWLEQTIITQGITVLIVAGDIFDTGTPPNYALQLYYTFLSRLSTTCCSNIIITAGNHDSVSTLRAPKELLKALNVHVLSSVDEDEVIPIYEDKHLCALVCAVPFLSDSMVRIAQEGQTLSDKESALSVGIKAHYKKVHAQALALCKESGDTDIPIIATGHLTTVGSKSSESEREIYIGGTLDIDSDFLGALFDYVALGHLHINQCVGCEHVRYSGSPLPLSFSESNSVKRINIVEFTRMSDGKRALSVEALAIPLSRPLLVLRGTLEEILVALEKIEDKRTWIEVHLHDENPHYANERIRERAQELDLNLLALKIDRSEKSLRAEDLEVISLDELNPLEVFERRIEDDGFENEDLKEALILNFKKILSEIEKR